jgi:hypothetical protein
MTNAIRTRKPEGGSGLSARAFHLALVGIVIQVGAYL